MLRRGMLMTVAAAALAFGPATEASAAPPDCTAQATAGTITRTIDDRTYALTVPAGLPAGAAAPLLVVLHGAGSSPGIDEASKQWLPFAAARGFIVAQPQARPFSFGGVWDPYTAASPDVAFLKSVVADVSGVFCVDPARVFLDGWSNGAVMEQRAACEAADVFAAGVSYGGGSPTVSGRPCSPSRPIAMALIAGQYDFTYASLASNTAQWRALNGCEATPGRTSDAYGTTDTYDCAAGTQVMSRTLANTSHNWPSGAAGEDQRARIWAFLSAHPRP